MTDAIEPDRFHILTGPGFAVDTEDGEAEIGSGWVAITQHEYDHLRAIESAAWDIRRKMEDPQGRVTCIEQDYLSGALDGICARFRRSLDPRQERFIRMVQAALKPLRLTYADLFPPAVVPDMPEAEISEGLGVCLPDEAFDEIRVMEAEAFILGSLERTGGGKPSPGVLRTQALKVLKAVRVPETAG